MSNTPTTARPAGRLADLLCRLGGMRAGLIDSMPDSRSYFINIAGAMLGLGLLAVTSFSYALVSTNIVADWRIAVVLGLGWATLMVTIERLLIISMKRHPKGGLLNVAQAAAGFVVRLGVAFVIGAVVSMPLVLKVFEPAVAAQVQADIVQSRTEATTKLDADFADIPVMEQQLAALNEKIATLPFYDPAEVNPAYATAQAARDSAKSACDAGNRAAAEEAAGQSGTGRSGYGPEWRRLAAVAKEKCAAYSKAEAEFGRISQETQEQYGQTASASKTTAEAERDRLDTVLAQRRAEREAQATTLFGAINTSDGLAARMQALWNLHEHNNAIYLGHMFLMFALMLVEVMPVFAKFLKTVGAIDDYHRIEVQREDSAVKDEEIYEADREKATRVRSGIQEASARDWYTKQLAVEHEINTEAVAVTKEIELERLEVWKQTERAKNAPEIAQARAKLNRTLAQTTAAAAPAPAPQQALGLNAP